MSSDQLQAERSEADVLSRMAKSAGFPGFASKLFPLDRVRDLYRRVSLCPDGFRLENLLTEMQIGLQVDAVDASRVPATGPVVVVANHPFGILDGAALSVLLTRLRPDVKVMTNLVLRDLPELKDRYIAIDPLQSDCSHESKRQVFREALDWLKQGGMLGMFPSSEVSHWQFPQAQVADPKWNALAVRLIRLTGASALPVYFRGQNGIGFQFFGMMHPRLRDAFLLQEFLQESEKTVEVRIGSEIASDSITTISDDSKAIEYLRWRTYLLAKRTKAQRSWPSMIASKRPLRLHKPIAPPVPTELLVEELERLPKDRMLAESGDFAVFSVKGSEAPVLLPEIGRLREITFRQAGEGTGRSLDLDRYDRYYWHLLLWHKARRELVGAYRVGSTAEILPLHGVRGLYSSTLFRYDERMFEKIGPALELGRSFVKPEYQRHYAPLLLLWKGIAGLVAQHPELPVLFGAVSISNDYSQASREMIYRFFESRMRDDELSAMIEPRRPFRPGRLRPWDCRVMCHALRHVEDLSKPIIDVESDGKGLPILLRQYAKIGGKLLGFNVDRKFSNTLDGLMLVDLRQTDSRVLERYMGREAAARFRQYHNL